MRRVVVLLLSALLMLGSTAAPAASVPQQEDRAHVAADVLMSSYDDATAWWPSSWWNSAVALTTMMDYMQRTGDTQYESIIDHTYETNKGEFPPGERSSDAIEGNFISRAIDDTEWWALAWIQAYDMTGDQKYLDAAVIIAEYVNGYWDTSTCGGGVWWDRERTYKNAITNGLYVRLTAALHNRIPGDTAWLDRATTAWEWYKNSGMINSDGLVNDGLTDTCENNGQTVYTYNQGLAIGGALEIYRATNDQAALDTATRLADAAINSPDLVVDGILTEECDADNASCDDNGKQFKGIFMRYLMDLADTTGSSTYRDFALTQADSIWNRDRDAENRLGQRWSGSAGDAENPNVFDWRTHASAFGGLLAALPPS